MARVGRSALAALALCCALPASAHAGMDRAALKKRLGAQAVVQVDPSTGTPRMLGKLNGTLSGPAGGSPESIASAYVHAHLADLGLTSADLSTLQAPGVTTSPGDIAQVVWKQAVDGVQSADSELRVAVAGDGSVLNVAGSPRHGLSLASKTPAVSSAEAARAAAGANATLKRPSLVLYDGKLAWQVLYRASADAVYAVTVDGTSGRVVDRRNLVKDDASASVWERYPGAAAGGTAHTVDLAPWLNGGAGATTLDGSNVWAWSDVDDDSVLNPSDADTYDPSNDQPDAGETVGLHNGTDFRWPFISAAGAHCDGSHLCGWNGATAASWQANRQQDAVQAFYFANVFHDHLAAAPIGFTAADGAFQGADRLLLESDDGAATATGSLPDDQHVNNANMYTPPDGMHPRMQMYLFNGGANSGFRSIDGGDDADIVFHEYTHGLSSRLVTDASGLAALDTAQAGAMGEAWSDWYAQDFLVTEFGQRPDMGAYTDFPGGSDIRTQPLDCAVGSNAAAGCPGGDSGHQGGYTYADFGKVVGGPEVHGDGEIWGETLWDVRSAFGSSKAESLITEGLRLTPPEPTFLDARNAILQADTALYAGADLTTLWGIFSKRGMGFYAAAVNSQDASPHADFSPPPAPGGSTGSLSGHVTDVDSGQPLAGASVAVAGFQTPGALPNGATLEAQSGGDGAYRIDGIPYGSYPEIVFSAPGYDIGTEPLALGSAGATLDKALRRDWSASAGGAQIVSETPASFQGCEADNAIDGSPTTAWSSNRPGVNQPANSFVVQLPATVDVTGFGIDPTEGCGDPTDAEASNITVDTSADDATWTRALQVFPGAADRNQTTTYLPTDGADGVRYVRVTILGTVGNYRYQDLTEFEVFGRPHNVPPSGTASATVSGSSAHIVASMSDPDGTIASYQWAFGDGATAATTSPAVDHVYPGPGTYRGTVTAVDSQGGKGTASFTVTIAGGGAAPVPTATPAPPPPSVPRPSFTLPSSGKKGSAAFTVKCAAECSASATLTVDAKTRRKLGLATLGTLKASLTGSHKLTIKLSSKAKAALKKHHLKSVTVTLKVTARYSGAAAVSSSKRVKIRV